MTIKAPKSKRKQFKLRTVIKKKSKAMHKKLKKQKKNQNRKKLKKDPGIPNLYPYKNQLLKTILKNKQAEFVKKTNKVADQEKNKSTKNDNNANNRNHKNIYFKEMKKVIDLSDVILIILDSRDPQNCRSKKIESEIIKRESTNINRAKLIILVLNKIDLIPANITLKWISYLRREYPTVAFKSSTQTQNKNLGHINKKGSKIKDSNSFLSSNLCFGANSLINILSNYCRSIETKKPLTVGVIGYPNVGKSSIINSLKRKKVVGSSPVPGFTKNIKEIKLNSKIKLLDSPGVILSNDDINTPSLVLRNSVKVEDISDPIEIVEKIVKTCKKEYLIEIYSIGEFKNANEFIYEVGKKRGILKKGGVINMEETAKSLIRDWNSGKINYYVEPPKVEEGGPVIVNSFEKEFNIDELLKENIKETRAMEMVDEHNSESVNMVLDGI